MSSRIVEATRVIARMEILHVARVLSSSYIYIYLCLILIAKRGFRRIFRIGVESYDLNINRNL